MQYVQYVHFDRIDAAVVILSLASVSFNRSIKRKVDKEIILAFGEHRTSASWLGFVRGESLSVEVHGLVLWSVIDAM